MNRCRNCTYWRWIRDENYGEWVGPHGECRLLDRWSELAWVAGSEGNDDDLSLVTKPEFGCIMWKGEEVKMAKNVIELDPKNLAREITMTLHLKNWKWWNFRLHLGSCIIALGCIVAGIEYEAEHDKQSELDQDDFFGYAGKPPLDRR